MKAYGTNEYINKEALPADPQPAALEQRLDLVARDPIEIAGDRVLDGAGGDAEVEGPSARRRRARRG